MELTVVIRTRDDEEFLLHTLRGIRAEETPCQLVIMNNNSLDRSLPKSCQDLADRVIAIADGTYRPGRVLNQAMDCNDSEIVVFLNADCIPLEKGWLRALIAPFGEDRVGATFGCQVPRPDCYPPFARDTRETFGDGSLQKRWRHCFSMAVSAVRREVWEIQAFDPKIRYSEDIAWSSAIKAVGFETRYVTEARVEHSHNYTVAQYYLRQFGEGEAEAKIFTWDNWRAGFVRYSLLPGLRQILRDTIYCLKRGELGWAFSSVLYRVAGTIGRRQGFLRGRKA